MKHVMKYGIGWLEKNQSAPYFMVAATILGVGGYWAGRIYFELVEKHFLNASRPPRAASPAIAAAAAASAD
jgi:hypothetical protein